MDVQVRLHAALGDTILNRMPVDARQGVPFVFEWDYGISVSCVEAFEWFVKDIERSGACKNGVPMQAICVWNTHGGSVECQNEILNLYDKLRRIGVKIVTVTEERAASMGSHLFVHGDERYMGENAVLEIHSIRCPKYEDMLVEDDRKRHGLALADKYVSDIARRLREALLVLESSLGGWNESQLDSYRKKTEIPVAILNTALGQLEMTRITREDAVRWKCVDEPDIPLIVREAIDQKRKNRRGLVFKTL